MKPLPEGRDKMCRDATLAQAKQIQQLEASQREIVAVLRAMLADRPTTANLHLRALETQLNEASDD